MNKIEYEMTTSGKSNESLDSMLRRFKKKVLADGILNEVKRRQFFMNKSTKRREKAKAARIKALKQTKKRTY